MKDILAIGDQARLPEAVDTALQMLSLIQSGGQLPLKITRVVTKEIDDGPRLKKKKSITFHIEED